MFVIMLDYSVREAKDNSGKNAASLWQDSIKSIFTQSLDRSQEPSVEFSYILGEYIGKLYWLDKAWVEENLEKIFPKIDNDHWKINFSGYLYNSMYIDSELYNLIKKRRSLC